MSHFLYFDPGTGALIVQFLAAAVAGFVLFYKTVLAKIKGLFGIKPEPTDDLPDQRDPNEAH